MISKVALKALVSRRLGPSGNETFNFRSLSVLIRDVPGSLCFPYVSLGSLTLLPLLCPGCWGEGKERRSMASGDLGSGVLCVEGRMAPPALAMGLNGISVEKAW